MKVASILRLEPEEEFMSTAPQITERAEQPYVAVKAQVTMQNISAIADRIPEVFGWLAAHGVAPAGAPFLKYNVIDMARLLEIEAGVPVAAVVDGDSSVLSGVLPAGRYATVIHVGHPAKLVDTTGELLAWAPSKDLVFDVSQTDAGERWGSRLEIYLTDPGQEPDLDKWETQLAFRLAG
jgi:effector-binding domain-containing protein